MRDDPLDTRELPQRLHAYGLSRRKLGIVRTFVAPSEVQPLRRLRDLPPGGALLVWGRAATHGLPPGHEIVRVEDGFLRSVGLGADLVPPLSLAFDRRGIYFDATLPSDLEHVLQNASFPDHLLARAAALRARLVASGMTKYNVGGAPWSRPARRPRVILVPGQVESDASIAYGASDLRRNIDLLRAVQEANPDAHVVYKPHPDVVAGLRAAGSDEARAEHLCDEILVDTPMGDLLPQVDEVHVLTSLAGFEALLREKRVVCYGQPFYAGWGLTKDVIGHTRRTRALTLDMLVAGALILYPTYVSGKTGVRTTPEAVLDELEAARQAANARPSSHAFALARWLVRRMLRRT
jgi:capsular polysaccharide export protein